MSTLMQPLKELLHICLCRYLSFFEKMIKELLFRITSRKRYSCQSFFKFSVLFRRRLNSRVWSSASIHTKLGAAHLITTDIPKYSDEFSFWISDHSSKSANLV